MVPVVVAAAVDTDDVENADVDVVIEDMIVRVHVRHDLDPSSNEVEYPESVELAEFAEVDFVHYVPEDPNNAAHVSGAGNRVYEKVRQVTQFPAAATAVVVVDVGFGLETANVSANVSANAKRHGSENPSVSDHPSTQTNP